MVVEAGDDVSHEEHIEGNIDGGNDDGDEVVDLGLFVFEAGELDGLVDVVLVVGDEAEFGGDGEVSDGKQEH